MKASWKGYIVLGQLGIPVRLFNATRSIKPSFKYLHEKDGSPVERRYKCRMEGSEIENSELIRAVEITPGTFITLTNDELEKTSEGKDKLIEINQFTDEANIDQAYFEKPYYVVPASGGQRAYALIREVLSRVKKVAIAQFSIYNNQHIAVLRNFGDLLMLNQLRYAAELVPRSEIKSPALPKPSPNEIDTLSAIIDRFSGRFYIEDYHDEQSELINELVERKAKGLPPPKMVEPQTPATDEDQLLPVLEKTLKSKRRLL